MSERKAVYKVTTKRCGTCAWLQCGTVAGVCLKRRPGQGDVRQETDAACLDWDELPFSDEPVEEEGE